MMTRATSSSLYSLNTRFPIPSLNLQFCHNTSTKLITLRPTFLRYPFVQEYSLNSHRHKNLYIKRLAFSYPLRIKASSMASSTETEAKPFSVLFVCLGNICRSPAAEGVFTDIVKKKGLDSKFKIDSAGTINYHEGNPADPRMRAAAKRRGIEITSMSRPIRPSDFRDFDIILAMDKQNREDILEAFNKWKFREKLPDNAHKKVRKCFRAVCHEFSVVLFCQVFTIMFVLFLQVKLMCSFCKKHNETEVPDPYYGGPQGFEKVLDILEDACDSLLDSILTETSGIQSS
ncbi:putative low molecular weight protein-tyrosine-phosphatase slr0328 isoform X1 [Jatropha curcas]|uniref:putative low molecular weight protein-tyrosine-phosphatase slr0328 isoform X1 n=1 Tax=Jatropha curcas TaxID=180498 RepID=UPI001893F249|nr:putative low molecular weight protein-tyrosine-phosphatase slr0328 isoform X1 [Jatropha curcas]